MENIMVWFDFGLLLCLIALVLLSNAFEFRPIRYIVTKYKMHRLNVTLTKIGNIKSIVNRCIVDETEVPDYVIDELRRLEKKWGVYNND